MASIHPSNARPWFRSPERICGNENRAPSQDSSQDQHFKKKERRASTVQQVQNEWNVGIYVNVLSIRNICTVDNTFEAVFFMRAMWVEPDASNKDPSEWFDPKIGFVNAVEEPTEFNAIKRICEWREGPNGEDVVEQRADFQGTFRDCFNLRQFPFDAQFLTIAITTNHHQPSWPNKFGTDCLTFFHDATESKYKQNLTMLTSFSVDTQPLIDAVNDPETKFSSVFIDVLARRRSSYFVWNVMIPVFLISSVGCTVYGIPMSDLADRLSVTLTLMLTNVAYKITVADSLPQLGYLTYLDYFTVFNFLFLVILAFENLVVGRNADKDWAEDFDDWTLFAMTLVYVLTSVIFIAKAWFLHTRSPEELRSERTRDVQG